MHSQVLFVLEAVHHLVRYQAVSHLNGRAILYDTSDVFSDPLHDVVGSLNRILEERLVMGKDKIDIFDMNEAISMCSRHVFVHLGHDDLCLFQGSLDHVHAYAQAKVAVLVWKRGLD